MYINHKVLDRSYRLTLTLFLAYFDVKVVRSLVAVRMARVALEIVGLAHVVLGALLLAARLPKRQARHGCSSGLQSDLEKKKKIII